MEFTHTRTLRFSASKMSMASTGWFSMTSAPRRFELDAGLGEALAKDVKNVVQGGFAELFHPVVGQRLRAAISDFESLVRGEEDGVFHVSCRRPGAAVQESRRLASGARYFV